MTLASVMVVVSAVAGSTAPAPAQQHTKTPGLTIEQRTQELTEWLKEYRAWEKWFDQWGNRVPEDNNHLTGKRKARPEPPPWLADVCAKDSIVDEQLVSACNIVLSWDDEPMQIIRRRDSPVTTSGGKTADRLIKSSFFQHVHLTGLWTTAQHPAATVYGIIGMQISVVEIGRYTFPATGVMLVMIPAGDGGHDWKPATTLALGVRLFDFMPLGHKTPLSLHLNIARTHILGLRDDPIVSESTSLNFVGFSVSGRRRH